MANTKETKDTKFSDYLRRLTADELAELIDEAQAALDSRPKEKKKKAD